MKKRMKQVSAVTLAACLFAAGLGTASFAAESVPEYLNMDSLRPLVKDGEEVTLKVVVVREASATSDVNNLWMVKFLEEEMNVNLEIEEVSEENSSERKNLMLAADDMPDLILGIPFTNDDIVKYGVEGGQLLPVSDYFSEELTPNILRTLEENPDAKDALTANDGKQYMLPFIDQKRIGAGDTIGSQRVFIDTTFMEAAGITEAPTTLDGFVDMLRAFKELDPSVMGVDEVYPLVSVSGLETLMFMNSFGWTTSDPYGASWDEETKSVVVPALTEKFADYIKLYHTLYSEGLIHPDYYTIDETTTRGLFAGNQVGVVGDWAPYLSIPTRFDDFIAVPALSSQYCPDGMVTQQRGYQSALAVISADTEYAELILKMFDYFYSEEGSIYCYAGPKAESDDTLGIVKGYVLGDNKDLAYQDVIDGDYSDNYAYQLNGAWLIQKLPCNRDLGYRGALKTLGVDDLPELDLTNPDDNYRYICYEAQKDHLVAGLPDFYGSADDVERYTDLYTSLSTYGANEVAKMIVGERPIEEADQLCGELMDMGGDEYLELIQKLYADYSR